MSCVSRLLAAFFIVLVLGASVAAAPSSAAALPCHEQMQAAPHTARTPQSVVVTALSDQKTSPSPCAAGHQHHECCFVSYLSQTGLVVAVPKGDKVSLPSVPVRVSRAQGGIFKPPRALA